MPESTVKRGTTRLADLDPDLVEAVPGADRPLATMLRVPTLSIGRGTWRPPAVADEASLGLLVSGGVAFRSVSAAGFATGDLLGPGDVISLRRTPPELPGGAVAAFGWQVIEPLTVAVLGARFVACVARWPMLAWRLLDRQAEHADRAAAHVALMHRQRVEERLLLVLWELAGRWGRVLPVGVLVPIALRHHQLAALTVSLRPSVTLALHRLTERCIAERCVRGYLLHDTFEVSWSRLAADAEETPARGWG